MSWVSTQVGGTYTDHPANQQPDNWLDIEDWGYSNQAGHPNLSPWQPLLRWQIEPSLMIGKRILVQRSMITLDGGGVKSKWI